MKTTTLFLIALCLAFCAASQIKAIGNINFGMDKKQVQALIKADRDAHRLKVGGGYFEPVPLSFKYDNGLSKMVFNYVADNAEIGLNTAAVYELINNCRETVKQAGGNVVLEQDFKTGNPLVMQINGKALLFMVSGGMRSISGTVYNVTMKMITAEQYEAGTNGLIKENANEAKTKL